MFSSYWGKCFRTSSVWSQTRASNISVSKLWPQNIVLTAEGIRCTIFDALFLLITLSLPSDFQRSRILCRNVLWVSILFLDQIPLIQTFILQTWLFVVSTYDFVGFSILLFSLRMKTVNQFGLAAHLMLRPVYQHHAFSVLLFIRCFYLISYYSIRFASTSLLGWTRGFGAWVLLLHFDFFLRIGVWRLIR